MAAEVEKIDIASLPGLTKEQAEVLTKMRDIFVSVSGDIKLLGGVIDTMVDGFKNAFAQKLDISQLKELDAITSAVKTQQPIQNTNQEKVDTTTSIKLTN